ncbi:unnamed protein product [Hyaloperonospora brassicae]|uniref:Uncharacterized protein n=1 Tax=Hyaloperonospora brassicae TaxID=162125 RepID=A0AAV0V4C8_HYABA|nr:unnamed protein product [Hyaloperonospora brassicae]
MQHLQGEKGQVDGLLQLLRAKLEDVEEENFDLRASMALFETETRLESDKRERAMQIQVTALESELAFLSEKLQTVERVKQRATREVEALQQKQLVEAKRRDAERRLRATKRRKQVTAIPASQTSTATTPLSQQLQQQLSVSVADTGVQTELDLHEARESDSSRSSRAVLKASNARVVSRLLTGPSRDLLTLLHGALAAERAQDGAVNERHTSQKSSGRKNPHSNNSNSSSSSPTQFLQSSLGHSSSNESLQCSPTCATGGASAGLVFSQSVFSQVTTRPIAPQASSMPSTELLETTQALQKTAATDRAKELYDVMGKMLSGDVSVVALAPVFVKYFAAWKELERPVLCSVLRVLYAVMHHSADFQRFLLVASAPFGATVSLNAGYQSGAGSVEHPRIALSGLRFSSLGEYLSARAERVSVAQNDLLELSETESTTAHNELRHKLMGALCRVIEGNIKEAAVVMDSLRVLCVWADLAFAHYSALVPDFKPLLASKSIPCILMTAESDLTVKAQALSLLSQLLRVPEVFAEVKIESKQSLLFHRCAKMLSCNKSDLSMEKACNMRAFQHEIVKVFWTAVTSFPSEGIRFVLESTYGPYSDVDGHRSILYHLVQLLDQETFEARTSGDNGVVQELVSDRIRWGLTQDAFALLGLLSRYVDLQIELGGDGHVQSFLAVLSFLSNLTHEDVQMDSVVVSARALIALMTLSG